MKTGVLSIERVRKREGVGTGGYLSCKRNISGRSCCCFSNRVKVTRGWWWKPVSDKDKGRKDPDQCEETRGCKIHALHSSKGEGEREPTNKTIETISFFPRVLDIYIYTRVYVRGRFSKSEELYKKHPPSCFSGS